MRRFPRSVRVLLVWKAFADRGFAAPFVQRDTPIVSVTVECRSHHCLIA